MKTKTVFLALPANIIFAIKLFIEFLKSIESGQLVWGIISILGSTFFSVGTYFLLKELYKSFKKG
jgi:hypothetical protein